MVAHGAGAANNQQRLAGDRTVEGDGALRREEWNAKASRLRKVNTVRQWHNIFLWQHHILGSRAEGSLPLRVQHPYPLTNTARIDTVAYRINDAGTVTMRNDHGKGQPSTTTTQARLPVRWVHTRDVHTHADFTRTRRWRVDLANVQDISGSTEFRVIGSAHAFSFAFLDKDSSCPWLSPCSSRRETPPRHLRFHA